VIKAGSQIVLLSLFISNKRHSVAKLQNDAYSKSPRSHFALMTQILNRNRQILLAVLIP